MDQTLALTSGQQFTPNTRGLNDSLAERAGEGGGGGCRKAERGGEKKRERKMEGHRETVTDTEFKRER